MNTKTCTKCLEAQPLDNYRAHVNTKDKLQTWCKSCTSDYNKHANENKLRKAIEVYGGCCSLCGTNDVKLELRSTGNRVPASVIAKVARETKRSDVQINILCAGCSTAKREGFPGSPDNPPEDTSKHNVSYERHFASHYA